MTEDTPDAATTPPDTPQTPEDDPQDDLTLGQVIGSALAAAVGVQSSQNRKRDFKRGKASHFIFIGIIGTTLFVVAMFLLVRLILSVAAQ